MLNLLNFFKFILKIRPLEEVLLCYLLILYHEKHQHGDRINFLYGGDIAVT